MKILSIALVLISSSTFAFKWKPITKTSIVCMSAETKVEAVKLLNGNLNGNKHSFLNANSFETASSPAVEGINLKNIKSVSSVSFIENAKAEGFRNESAACVTVRHDK